MPACPAAHFIVGHPQFAFGVLKGPFDPITLPLHITQTFPRDRWGGITQAVFEGAILFLAHHQPASAGTLTRWFPLPHRHGPEFGAQSAPRALAESNHPAARSKGTGG